MPLTTPNKANKRNIITPLKTIQCPSSPPMEHVDILFTICVYSAALGKVPSNNKARGFKTISKHLVNFIAYFMVANYSKFCLLHSTNKIAFSRNSMWRRRSSFETFKVKSTYHFISSWELLFSENLLIFRFCSMLQSVWSVRFVSQN